MADLPIGVPSIPTVPTGGVDFMELILQLFTTAVPYILIFLVVALMALVVFLATKKQILWQSKLKVRIWKRRGDSIFPDETVTARYMVDDDGKERLQMRRFTMIPPFFTSEFIFQVPYKFIDANETINLFSPQRGEYIPVKVNITQDNKLKFEPQIDKSMIMAYIDYKEKLTERFNKPSLVDKILPLVYLACLGIITMIILMVVLERMAPIANSFVAASRNFAEAKMLCQGAAVATGTPF